MRTLESWSSDITRVYASRTHDLKTGARDSKDNWPLVFSQASVVCEMENPVHQTAEMLS